MSSNIWRHKIQKLFGITHLICTMGQQRQKTPNSLSSFGNATSEHKISQTFAGLILTSEINPKNLIDILKIGYFTEQSIQWRQILFCNTGSPVKCKLGHVTSPNLLVDVIASISRH